MTCTIAFLDKKSKTAWMASDSCASSTLDYSIVKNDKVFFAKGCSDILIGCAGSFRIMNILKYSKLFISGKQTTCDYIFNKVIPALKDCSDLEQNDDWVVLVATSTKLFKIQSDFAVLELFSTIEAIGNGGYTALGAFCAYDSLSKFSKMSTEDKLKCSLKLSKQFNVGVLEPFKIIHT